MTAPQPTRTKLGTARATITTDRYHAERTPVTRVIKHGLPIHTRPA